MRSNNIFSYILLIILVLLVFGVISFGDVLNVVFYIIMAVVFLALAGILYLRYRLYKIRRDAQRNGGNPGGAFGGSYSRNTAGRERARRPEGDIKVEHTQTSRTKVVRNDIGEYVEYEEIDEETRTE